MKRYKHLYSNLSAFANLHQAYLYARKNKRYRPDVATFTLNLDKELCVLYDELVTETWQPGGYRSFTVHEPKRRKISATPAPII